ncbi:hypothetical protein [Ferrimicrobium acidiphilum]|uniref:hypothetical protein n=1 Tax=Ferrimicrobium acidiphilum TaxID=121039 RepID=UPI0023F5969A|nr:hypothetical protein [Ferrimicrobium acidiphilum]
MPDTNPVPGSALAGASLAPTKQFHASRSDAGPPRARSAALWIAMRGTGLLLSVLVLGHLLFVHILTDVSATNASFVARRWSSALWVTWDGTMLTAAFLHGAIGMTAVIRDYVSRRIPRQICLGAMYIVSAGLSCLGWYAILATVLSSQK